MPSGNVGTVNVTALYSQCNQPSNTSSSAILWYGTPVIAGQTVDGSPSQSLNSVNWNDVLLNVDSQAATSWTWTVIGGTGTLYPQGPKCHFFFTNFAIVKVQANNRCGGGQSYFFYIMRSGYNGYSVYPNPTEDKIKIDFESKELAEANLNGIFIYDDQEKIVQQFDVEAARKSDFFKNQNTLEMDMSALKKGTYFLHLRLGDHVFKTQVLKK
ncbi:MAG: T9SS C-terminal target domain-containing protein [Runella slithyformis]|nr:MAG: T9SS C-terminal target domain-containing protein [Runella slithyformis]